MKNSALLGQQWLSRSLAILSIVAVAFLTGCSSDGECSPGTACGSRSDGGSGGRDAGWMTDSSDTDGDGVTDAYDCDPMNPAIGRQAERLCEATCGAGRETCREGVWSACGCGGCSDGASNGTETGIDCGGGSCPVCAIGDSCRVGADCASGVCLNDACASPSCSDSTINGTEADVDCGGSECPPCPPERICGSDADCESQRCGDGYCLAPRCDDDVQNGSETDHDCGGEQCARCGAGARCAGPSDCSSNLCLEGTCSEPSCVDTVQNGSETDVDCGGTGCPGCALGRRCGDGDDCVTTVCTSGQCVDSSCADGVRGGSETDVDCGGPACAGCDDGDMCGSAGDCASSVCTAGTCATASCTDGVHNGGETGIDCGGSCGPCPNGQPCAGGSACQSGYCASGICAACGSAAQCPAMQGCVSGACRACTGSAQCTPTDACVSGRCTDCSVSPECVSGRVCNHGQCNVGSPVSLYQCPQHTIGQLGGGSWGFYGCHGQMWSVGSCTTTEWPNSTTESCSPVGRMTLTGMGEPTPPGTVRYPMYQCPPNRSLGGGAWGYTECLGQLSSNSSCLIIEYPSSVTDPCTYAGMMTIHTAATPSAPPAGRVVPMYQCPVVSTIGGGAWGYYECRGQITAKSTCLTIEYPSQQTSNCAPIGSLVLEP